MRARGRRAGWPGAVLQTRARAFMSWLVRMWPPDVPHQAATPIILDCDPGHAALAVMCATAHSGCGCFAIGTVAGTVT